MKIIFDYQGERRYITLKNYYSLWEILECLEQQTDENGMVIKYDKQPNTKTIRNLR